MEVLLKEFAVLVVTLLLIGLGSERGIQLVKSLIRLLADEFENIPYIAGSSSFILAAIVAGLVSFIPGVQFEFIADYLPELGPAFTNILEALLVLFAATKSHNQLFSENG
jgi:hypothetical protein